jgi:alpha-mannosidase
VWTVKPAEEGIDKGVIVRVWNIDNEDSDCSFTSEMKITGAYKTTHIETDGVEIVPVDGELNTRIGHNKIETFRLFLE